MRRIDASDDNDGAEGTAVGIVDGSEDPEAISTTFARTRTVRLRATHQAKKNEYRFETIPIPETCNRPGDHVRSSFYRDVNS